jgi:hypothetical protein
MNLRHYLMTRSYRGPDYPLDANARRIALLRGITARSLSEQAGDWTWLAFVAPDDPLREDRLDAFRSAGHPVIPVTSTAEAETAIDWSGPVLTTRIDDDDGFSMDAFARLYAAVLPASVPWAYIFPVGYHVRDGRVAMNRHLRNAWPSVYSPVGFREHALTHQHQRIPAAYPVTFIDDGPAWLRVSHQDNGRPTSHRPHGAITSTIRALFPVDWDLLAPRVAA